ncbi:Small RNA degrading nuclease 5 [Clonorchis sinensis]|uniref:Small RNA degrading nuclease 5 n=1 Tax=Clonorchis sinensis TaxID=79923 RepID=A0A8T1N132_CLOSI|nr:Small RNA degrading nuclease 5 [Clonorchis sinensis]
MGFAETTKLSKKSKVPFLFFNEEKLRTKHTLYASELQKLIGLIFFPQHYSAWPDWCVIRKPALINSVVLLFCDRLQCITSGDPILQSVFDKALCFYTPTAYNHTWEAEILQVPRSHLSKHALNMVDKNLPITSPAPKREWVKSTVAEAATELDRLTRLADRICSSDEPVPQVTTKGNAPKRKLDMARPFPMPATGSPDAFDRTKLLMNLEQMLYERIPVPAELDEQSKRGASNPAYVPSKTAYQPVSSTSPMFAIDCEMVVTKLGSELARVTMVDESDFVVFDRLVKPENPVEDYVTKFSGITRDMLAPVTTTVADIQRELDELLPPDAILVGHSIANDLQAMKIYHPYLIDTSVIYNLKGARTSKARLRFLAEHFLGRMIQTGTSGHSSAEDAIATMDLVRLKLSQDLSFGDVTTSWRFPEHYYALPSAVRSKTSNRKRVDHDTKPSEDKPSDNVIPNGLSVDNVHPAFRSKVTELRQSYRFLGPPVHFLTRLLKDSNIPFSYVPVHESDDPQGPTSNGRSAFPEVTDSYLSRPSTKLANHLAESARTNRFILAKAHCPSDWNEEKCNKKLAKLSSNLYKGLPEHSLLIVVCTGEGLDSSAPSVGPVLGSNELDANSRLRSSILSAQMLENAKRYAYITLTKPQQPTTNDES